MKMIVCQLTPDDSSGSWPGIQNSGWTIWPTFKTPMTAAGLFMIKRNTTTTVNPPPIRAGM